jgi:cytochrome c2
MANPRSRRLLLLLPWLDRNPRRRPSARKIALGLGGACFVAVLGLTLAGHWALRREEAAAAERQVAAPTPAPPTPQAAPEPELAARGGQLYETLRCDACHGPEREQLIAGLPPALSYAGSKLQSSWMEAYLKDPQPIRWLDEGRRPTLRMPDYRLTDDEARALAAHLAGQAEPARFDQSVDAAVLAAANADEGRRLFQQYNCLGCHALDGQGSRVGPDLTHVGGRLREPYLYIFLKSPEAIIPGTPMQSVDLWPEEAAVLTKYLSTLK